MKWCDESARILFDQWLRKGCKAYTKEKLNWGKNSSTKVNKHSKKCRTLQVETYGLCIFVWETFHVHHQINECITALECDIKFILMVNLFPQVPVSYLPGFFSLKVFNWNVSTAHQNPAYVRISVQISPKTNHKIWKLNSRAL